jgi:hypothetical protein
MGYDGDGNRVSETVGGTTTKISSTRRATRRCDLPPVFRTPENTTESFAHLRLERNAKGQIEARVVLGL